MYTDMGGRIAGKQDRPSLIIEGLPRAPQIAKNCKTKSRWGRGYYVIYRGYHHNEIYVQQRNIIVPFGMGLAGALQYADWVHLASQL